MTAGAGLRQAHVELLMTQVRDGRYPSPTMLDRVEAVISDRPSAERYVRSLLEQVGADRYPSPVMLDRLARLIDVLEPPGTGVQE